MIDDDPDLEPKYRAPRAFGPMPGPRNIPFSQRDATGAPDEVTTSLSVSLEADPGELARLLPPDTRLSGAPTLTVTATRFENLRWLAGRGYPILTVTFPVSYVGDDVDQAVEARYLAVLWEGLPDPVTTGREELGFPKLFADIRAPGVEDVSAAGGAEADASWDGFRFLDLSAEDLRDVPPAEAASPPGTLVHRFVPSLEAPGQAEIDHLVHHPRPASARGTVTDFRCGTGRFRFHHARFADVPVQYTVINTLAALTLGATGPATLTRTTAAPGGAAGGAIPRLLGGTARARTAGVSA